jgi:hypothetical protein
MSNGREGGLLRWQWELYPRGHRARLTLLVHLLTAPLFMAGTIELVTSPLTHWWNAIAGFGTMLAVVIVQGRTHAREATKPEPFLGPHDVAMRIFVEQWVTFPRFVFSGKFGEAWRAAGQPQ